MQSQPELIRFDGPLNVRSIQPAHKDLLKAMQANQSLVVDIPDVADADIAFIQLIESARIYAASSGKTFKLARPAGAPMQAVLQRAGFTDSLTPDRAAFWFHQGE